MSETLRRIVNTATFSTLQDKLERWLKDYYLNTCDQNVNRCCDIIEQNSRLQSQLFKLLNLTATEGGLYGGASVIRNRLLPLLGQSGVVNGDYGLSSALQIAKDQELNNIQDMYERSLSSMQSDLSNSKLQAEELKQRLDYAETELESTRRKSVSEKMFTEAEVSDMRARIRTLEDELSLVKSRSELVDNYERQIRRLKEDLAVFSTGRNYAPTLPEPVNRSRAPSRSQSRAASRPSSPGPQRSLSRAGTSPLDADDVTQRVREQALITRYSDLFALDRLDALDTLRRYTDDIENNQRIVFSALQESFTAAKLAFTSYKMRVRSNIAISHRGPETLEEAVQDYINRNVDTFDLPGLVADVLRALNRNPRLHLPVDISYSVIQPFIREACKMAWNMSALAHPLDIASAVDSELFDESKYRRSYDSEWSAPLVSHFIWPALVQGYKVIMKGEAVTRRASSFSSTVTRGRTASPSRNASRASSPIRTQSRLRSRSPSPSRRELFDSGFSAYSSRSASPSRALTSSTSLSHYGLRS